MIASKLLFELEKKIDEAKLKDYAKILNREYKLGLTDKQIWTLMLSIFGEKHKPLFERYTKCLVANEIVNAIVMKYYPGEKIVKYNFVQQLINKNEEVTLFEMYADNSRVDLCRINGKSIAYEIKTEIDGLRRLDKQIDDYSKIFEYIYVIIDMKHMLKVKEILPPHCGIISYRLNNGKCIFSYRKKATKSPNLSPEAQVRNMSSQDLQLILKKQEARSIPSKKGDRTELLLSRSNKNQINRFFKYVIKRKYSNQWSFIKEHFDKIYPIDIQSFFHNPIDPELAYYKVRI